MEIVRDGKATKLKVTIEEQPQTFGSTTPGELPDLDKGALTVEKVGLVVADLTPEWGERLGYPEAARGR